MTTENYLSLKTFVPGTKAKADEVNSNFNILKEAIMQRASSEGDSMQTFEVAPAQRASQAVNKAQLDSMQDTLTALFAKFGYRFCIRKGNTQDGEADLFDYSYMTVTPKIGGAFANLVISDYTGKTYEITSVEQFTMQGKPNGIYNIFITSEGEIYTAQNHIYSQKSRPNLIDGDIWLNTSCEPLRCIKYTNNQDLEFLDVPLGQIVIEDNLIKSIKTNEFVTNGYDVTYNNLPSYKYDYANMVSKAIGVTHIAECDGLLHARGRLTNTNCVIIIEGHSFTIHQSSSQGSIAGGFIPIFKGQSYLLTSGSSFSFIPKVKC